MVSVACNALLKFTLQLGDKTNRLLEKAVLQTNDRSGGRRRTPKPLFAELLPFHYVQCFFPGLEVVWLKLALWVQGRAPAQTWVIQNLPLLTITETESYFKYLYSGDLLWKEIEEIEFKEIN